MGPDTPLDKLLGTLNAKGFAAHLDLHTVGQLLHHYPRRYVERGELTPLRDLVVGEHVTVSARVKSRSIRSTRGGLWLVEFVVTDSTGDLRLSFFYKHPSKAQWRFGQHAEGWIGLFAGRVSVFSGRLQLQHPEILDEVQDPLIPIYRAAEQISTQKIGKAVQVALAGFDLPDDPLPADLVRRHGLMDLARALEGIHRPTDWAYLKAAEKRLKWDEAFLLQVFLAQRRREIQAIGGRPRLGRPGGVRDAFDAALPFTLTAGQRSVGEVLDDELAQPHAMHRLLQGEVGSGKTIVALRAMLRVVDSGGQAALLAPTEVLAQQHLRSLRTMLGALATAGELGSPEVATRVTLLTGSLSAAARRTAVAQIASGAAGIVVGTHALLSEGVDFRDLGLVVIDEQHRFGVEQRDLLRAKGGAPHTLVMTATPIPRTIAMTVYGDLETSTLTELPVGRSPLTTRVVELQGPFYGRLWERVREEVGAGRQGFVVCPRIGGEEKDEDPEQGQEEGKRPSISVVDLLPTLVEGPLSGLRVEGLHGRMTAEAKEDVMSRFVTGDIDVLVATTVIEVGVDVPNATVMVVMDAERFGISQLHQLRGRVGRGDHPGLCVLVTEVASDTPQGERLSAVAETTDGFRLAQVDLEQRREGDVLGTFQSGTAHALRLLQVTRDEDVIVEARQEAIALVDDDPELERHPALGAAVRGMLNEQHVKYLEKA